MSRIPFWNAARLSCIKTSVFIEFLLRGGGNANAALDLCTKTMQKLHYWHAAPDWVAPQR
jgi:hypothetical protein